MKAFEKQPKIRMNTELYRHSDSRFSPVIMVE
jgi:hypothetical protein